MSRDFRPQHWTRSARPLALVACLAALLLTPAGAVGDQTNPLNEVLKQQVARFGGGAMSITARALGVDEVRGKPIGANANAGLRTASDGGPGPISPWQPASSPNNLAIRDFPNVSEDEPTVVANPLDPEKLVAGTHFIGDTANRCVAHYSTDGGETWNSHFPTFMPQLTHASQCSDPVLAYAPDGSRVYFAYMDIKFDDFWDILVSYSDDDGQTWTGPIVAMDGNLVTSNYDKPWIGTHVPVGEDPNQSNSNWVYVSATRFEAQSPFRCFISFTQSPDKGTTWFVPNVLDTSGGACGDPVVVQGSRPTGGLGNDVLLAWYHSGQDGWLEGKFQIRTRYSSDNGFSWARNITASDERFEAPFWLGPFAGYHRWWGVMFPDVEIAPNGSAHLAYAHDTVANPGGFSETPEDGDIRYIGSAAAPYRAWSAPVTVNDDVSGKAQGWATLEAGMEGGNPLLYLLWEDHRSSPADNLEYDVLWSKKTVSTPWQPNVKLTDESSTSDFVFLGDYFDITLSGSDVYTVWTDRRDEPTEFDFDDDVWGASIPT